MSDTNFILPTYPPGRNTGPTALRTAARGGSSIMSGGGGVVPATITLTPATSCGLGTPYTVYLDRCETTCDGPQPRLRLVPASGSGAATITFSRVGCSAGGGQFTTDNPLFCTGDADTPCGDNLVTATVECVACPAVYRKFASLDCGGACGCTGVTEVPATLCISFTLTAGSDCLGVDGSVQELPLTGGPAGSPVNDGFSSFVGSGFSGNTTPWLLWGAYTLLADGTIFDNTTAGQCATQAFPDPLPAVLTFNGGTAPYGYVLSFATGAWVLTYGAETFSPASTDVDAQTITFDVSGSVLAAAAFGSTASALTFLLGGNPKYSYLKESYGRHYWGLLGSGLGSNCSVFAGVSAEILEGFSPSSAVFNNWTVGPGADDAICEISDGTTLTQTAVGYGASGFCNSTDYPTSAYTITLEPDAVCDENPIFSESWNCLADGTCVDPGDGSGTYATEAACLAACSTDLPPAECCPNACGTTLTLTITGGADAGTYTATAYCYPSSLTAVFIVSGTVSYSLLCDPENGWLLGRIESSAISGQESASSASCDPAIALTFPATSFPSGTSSITVT